MDGESSPAHFFAADASGLLDSLVETVAQRRPCLGAEASSAAEGLRAWLAQHGAEECFEQFLAEGFDSVDAVVESRLGDNDLRELGVRQMRPRKQLLQAMRQQQQHVANPLSHGHHLSATGAAAAAAAAYNSEGGLEGAVTRLVGVLEPAIPVIIAHLEVNSHRRHQPVAASSSTGTAAAAAAAAAGGAYEVGGAAAAVAGPVPLRVGEPAEYIRNRGMLPKYVTAPADQGPYQPQGQGQPSMGGRRTLHRRRQEPVQARERRRRPRRRSQRRRP